MIRILRVRQSGYEKNRLLPCKEITRLNPEIPSRNGTKTDPAKCSGAGGILIRQFTVGSRAVDPHSLYADPDPAVFLNADPGPGLA